MRTMIIIAIIVIVIVIWMLMRRKSEAPSANKTMQIEQVFEITIGNKTDQNHLLNKGSPQAFYVNGLEAPTIVLRRNVFYEFKNLTDEPFYFSSDPDGGYKELPDGTLEEAPGSISKDFKGLAGGSIYFMATDDLPVHFYYQSGKHQNMGSIVQLR